MTVFQNEFDQARLNLGSKLDHDVAALLQKENATVSIAESITGGHILSRFSMLPNYENVLHGGIVCKHPLSFMTFCGLSPADFNDCQSNPSKLAQLMLDRIFNQTKSSICLSSAGFIERKQNPTKSAKIYLGFLIRNQKKVKALEITGTRTTIYQQAAQASLAFLRQLLSSMTGTEINIKGANNG